MRQGKGEGGRFAVMLVGFGLLCCASVACVFPNFLISNEASSDVYRAFNMALGVATSASALCYGAAVARSRRAVDEVYFAGAMAGYGVFACGLALAFATGQGGGVVLAGVAGALSGVGLAPAMVFWFGMLTFLPERRALFAQGWQALVGGSLFAAVFSMAAGAGQAVLSMCVPASCLCAVVVRRMTWSREERPFFQGEARVGLGASDGISDALQAVALPVAGFVVVSFLHGALVAIAMAPEGSPWGGLASSWGAPVGACAFLLWARFGRRRSYAAALQVVLCLIAAVLVLVPFDALIFFMGAGYQVCGLLFYSLVIDELSSRRSLAIMLISVGYAFSHAAFLAGLYVPGAFGVRSYDAFHYSMPLVIFLAYVVFAALLFVTQRSRKRELREMEQALNRQREEKERLRRALADASEEEHAEACRAIGRRCGLTKRETEVLDLLARGRDVAFICEELYLARNTVKGYAKRIYAKLGVHSKQEVIDAVEIERRMRS
ncbi:hypothetical protein B5F40_00945 [Gordonibacter sp. An230]|uniref:LuxR C-terminal-related transcriptional regulator n=1 Tax=Gordonibacter sp. An230 TaxID=1965592 RepID=UPI000B562B72|nr:LuxR C-terminal-related transcriptional regulator [Gordonibacter sp. An230]OUO92495.1 hypothetical protein B5F40_00945 [Gordonibacter sp. An230]